jgi:hypothetical protein
MVKAFSATFSLDGNSTFCAHDSTKEGDVDGSYYCDLRGRPGPDSKVTCDGPGLLLGIMKCRFFVDVVEETILVSVFKERYA